MPTALPRRPCRSPRPASAHLRGAVSALALGLLAAGCGGGSGGTVDADARATLDALKARVATLETALAAAQADVAALTTSTAGQGTRLSAAEGAVTAHDARLLSVEGKTASVFTETIDGAPAVVFRGVNVHVQSGSGATDDGSASGGTLRGLGNLVIGYNALLGSGDLRTGSHNLVVGDYNSYSSYGGVVFGAGNASSAGYATVVGGGSNVASGLLSSVTGGQNNKASGGGASVAGGIQNVASGVSASVAGGSSNSAIGTTASVVGGYLNEAQGDNSSVSGGQVNKAVGRQSAVAGGEQNRASGFLSSVGGGSAREAFTDRYALSGDPLLTGVDGRVAALETKTANVFAETVGGKPALVFRGVNVHVQSGSGVTSDAGALTGLGNLVIGYSSWRVPGDVQVGSHNLVVGDYNHYSSYGGVVFGSWNQITMPYATVLGGGYNGGDGSNSAVAGGQGNSASGAYAAVGGGHGVTAATGDSPWGAGGVNAGAAGSFLGTYHSP